MPLAYSYPDAYLQPLVTQAREDAAAADVAQLGTLPTHWVARLVVLRAYVITCLESQKAPDDLFSAKLAAYRKEYDAALAQGRAAQMAVNAAAAPGGAASPFTVSLERA
jgi:hypothetical protein